MQNLITFLHQRAPLVLADFLSLSNEFVQTHLHQAPLPIGESDEKPLNVIDDDGSGRQYTITTQPITEDVIAHIRTGYANGIILEKAGQWFGGFITGVMLAK